MSTMNISLPEGLKQYVKQRVEEGEYSNPSDFVRALIRADKQRRAEQILEKLLIEGLTSGEPKEVTNQFWERKKTELTQRLKAKTRA